MPDAFLLEVPPAGTGFWQAFHTLSEMRTTGGGMSALPNPIAFSEIAAYARAYWMDLDETVQVIQMLDAVWRAETLKRLKPKQKKKKKGADSPSA